MDKAANETHASETRIYSKCWSILEQPKHNPHISRSTSVKKTSLQVLQFLSIIVADADSKAIVSGQQVAAIKR